jgi:hypothetical protein
VTTKAGALVESGLAESLADAKAQLADMRESNAKLTSPRRTRKTTTTPKTAAKSPQKPARKTPAAKKLTAEALAELASKARNARHLAKLAGVPDDLTFRRFVAHHSEGSRVLSRWREKLHSNDPGTYDFYAAARARKAQAAEPKPETKPRSRTPKAKR